MKNNNTTETLPKSDQYIDILDNDTALSLMLDNQAEAIDAIRESLPSINQAVTKIVKTLSQNKKSKLIYVGAGTSGRIAVQDGVELYPTFGWPRERVSFLIAGGIEALTASIENAEDNIVAANENLKGLKLNSNDVVI